MSGSDAESPHSGSRRKSAREPRPEASLKWSPNHAALDDDPRARGKAAKARAKEMRKAVESRRFEKEERREGKRRAEEVQQHPVAAAAAKPGQSQSSARKEQEQQPAPARERRSRGRAVVAADAAAEAAADTAAAVGGDGGEGGEDGKEAAVTFSDLPPEVCLDIVLIVLKCIVSYCIELNHTLRPKIGEPIAGA